MTNIFLGVTATAVCFLGGLFFRSVLTLVLDKRPAGQVWLARAGEPIEIVITSAPLRHEDEASGLVYPAEATAAAEIALFMRSTFKSKTRISTSDRFSSSALRQDLLILGGPVHNGVTRHFLERLGLEELLDGYAIIGKDGKRYEAQTAKIAGQEQVIEDYGLVVRAPNPYNEKRRVTILIGSRTAGTLIAARSLIDPMIRPTARAIHSGESFHLISSSSAIDGEPGEIRIEESW